MVSSMAQLPLIGNLFSPKDASQPKQSRSANCFAEHFATLLTLRGYFNQLELESIVQTKDGVWEFRRNSRKIRALPVSSYRKTLPMKIDDFRNELNRLKPQTAANKQTNCDYWLVLDANLNTFSKEFDSEVSQVDGVFGESANISESDQTIALILPDAKAEASKLIAEQLNIDEFYADIIRQLVSKLIFDANEGQKLSIFAKPNQVSKTDIHWIIREILLHRSGTSFDPNKLSRAISIVTFPPSEAKNPSFSNLNIRPEHLSSKYFVERPELVEKVLQYLKQFRSCAVTAVIGTGSSALLWSIVKETSDSRCWYEVNSNSSLDIETLTKIISSYRFDYPIGFVIDNINLGNSRAFRSLVEATKLNENVWVAGSVNSENLYLVTAEKSTAVFPMFFDEEFDKVLVSQTAEFLSDTRKSKEEIEKIITEANPGTDTAVTHGNLSINQTLDKLLLKRYEIIMKYGGPKRKSKTISFRKNKKSRKQKTRQKQNPSQIAQTRPSIEQNKEHSQEDQQLLQDCNDEIDVLTAIALVIASEGRVEVASLQSNLTLEYPRLISAIDRLQTIGLYYKDEKTDTVFGSHPVSTSDMCRALVDVGFASKSELSSAAIENADPNLLEEIVAKAVELKHLNNAEITAAIENRFKNRRQNSLSSASSIENSSRPQDYIDILTRDLEESIQLARGFFHGHILNISKDWAETILSPELPQFYCLVAVSNAITGFMGIRANDSHSYKAYSRGESWYRRVKAIKLPRVILSNIVDSLTGQFNKLDSYLICEAMEVLQGHSVERHYIRQLRDIRSIVARTFVSMHIEHVMKIIDLAYCLSPELCDDWLQAYDQLEGTVPLITRVHQNTPFALEYGEEEDDFGKFFSANIYKDILNEDSIDLQNIANHYNNSMILLNSEPLLTVTTVVDENDKEIESTPCVVTSKRDATIARQNFAVNAGIAVAKFVGAPSWAAYLEKATKCLEAIHGIGSVYLNFECSKIESGEVFQRLLPFLWEGTDLAAPFDLNRYKMLDEFEVQPLQRLSQVLNLNAFMGFRDLPEGAKYYHQDAQRARYFCHQAYNEPWEHIGGNPPKILQDIENLARDMQVVGLVAEELEMHPIEKWPVPAALNETSFAYIVGRCHQNMSTKQKQELQLADVSTGKIAKEDISLPLPERFNVLKESES